MQYRITTVTLVLLGLILMVKGHGRLRVPPARSTLWRDGITPNVVDYNDNQLYCGGKEVQFNNINKGRCGLCGDAYHLPQPRPHEHGGKYGLGTIAGSYTQGQIIDIAIELTAHHKGWFEFKLCPYAPATQDCLDSNKLQLTTGTYRYMLPNNGAGFYNMSAHLPPAVSCQQCVLQWRYHTGNSWGCFDGGQCCTGCGDKQEEFYGCADIRIHATAAKPSTTESSTSTTVQATTTTTATTTQKADSAKEAVTETTSFLPSTTSDETESTSTSSTTTTAAEEPPSGNVGECRAVGVWEGDVSMDKWCNDNCYHTPPYCPSTICECSSKVDILTKTSTSSTSLSTTEPTEVSSTSTSSSSTESTAISTSSTSTPTTESPQCMLYIPDDTTDLFLTLFCRSSRCSTGNCPSVCRCADTLVCHGTGTLASEEGDDFCTFKCRQGDCPPKHCTCS